MKKVMMLAALISLAFASTKNPDGGFAVGDIATDFSLKNVDGTQVSLTAYSDAKGFIVVFTCNTCPYAKLYEQRIIGLDAKYSSQGYPVVAIQPNDVSLSPGDSFTEMRSHARKKGFTFPYLLDESQHVARTYGATRTPHVFVLTRQAGKLKVAYIGAIDNNYKDASAADTKYVENAVDALLAYNKVHVASTKAIGCGIKWSEQK